MRTASAEAAFAGRETRRQRHKGMAARGSTAVKPSISKRRKGRR